MKIPVKAKTALARAIKLAGGNSAFARSLGITPQASSAWKQTPHTRVLKIERLYGVPRGELRPDLYPDEVSKVPRLMAQRN